MQNNKVFVGSLTPEFTDEDLRKMFKKFGEITEAVVMVNKITGKSKCFGFVTFLNHNEAEVAIAEMDQHEMDGKKMLVTFAKVNS